MRFDLWQGDLEPLELTLTGVSDLTGATCTLTMAQVNGSKRVTGPFVLTDPVARKGYFAPAATDTDTPGVYRGVVRAVLSDGTPETFPSDEPFYVVIHSSI